MKSDGGPGMDDSDLDRAVSDLGLDGSQVEADTGGRPHTPWWRRVSTWALVYLPVVFYIVFWPEPSDFGLSPWLREIREFAPMLTSVRVEFVANILLFVPFGVGLALMLPRHRYLVVPLGLLATLTIEGVQALLLSGRSPTVIDLVANVAGACVGLVAVAAFEGLFRRRAD